MTDIAASYAGAINAADLEALLALFAPTAVLRNPFGEFSGIDEIRGFYTGTVLAGQTSLTVRSVERLDPRTVKAVLVASSPLGEPGNELLAVDEFQLDADGRIVALDITYP